MPDNLLFRAAVQRDAPQIAELLQDSIRQLCVNDHGNAERPLRQWLANKTPENVRQWLKNPANVILVAEIDGRVAATGGLRRDGHMILNYVAPAFRFQGISRAMVAELERCARQLGVGAITLESTVTAHNFYLSLGYRDGADRGAKHGLENYPMSKFIE